MSGLHVHAWRFVAHVDGCHWYATTAACDCGATLHQTAERDVKEDPYSAVWMEDDRDDDKACRRCRDLLAGAPPDPFTEVIEHG
jgi:hypothetical protein